MTLSDVKTRDDIPRFLFENYPGGTGVELGVSKGSYSHILLAQSGLRRLYSIDRWEGDRGHDLRQYLGVMNGLLGFGERSIVLRLTFQEALSLFDDDHFDFVYIDGYAHTGQDDGATIRGWWPKVKKGGLFAGHDYHPAFPKTVEQVDRFSREVDSQLHLTGEAKYPSWLMLK